MPSRLVKINWPFRLSRLSFIDNAMSRKGRVHAISCRCRFEVLSSTLLFFGCAEFVYVW
jgi:hypothetical protein